ncbi:lipoprotein-releasing ABC transporter permease subunit [Thiomicrospira cyclica]|uniref:Lipoprotein releasing system, transmembrane protein, LolC/E family n=1 Tax=Thiomicrospira cyclica (strain DSM 14477 / JCM 11371 / ALM1) TaxID=717773 RepID=F6D8J4_THICA|nr:lipoprotein-releasing ABC transporter permease subunit [Thiomicrospira cyclica]AEG31845.1 lipoprotein releasing system, transmembrane protein, LolC/E family [Thiomicrospira cyclica ALM1]
MFKLPVELLLGTRYIRAKRRNGFISFISMSSMIGIALGVMALITVMSIMNGFQHELRERILGMTAHMTISDRPSYLADWQATRELALQHSQVIGAAPNIQEQAMLSHRDRVQGVMVRGVLPELETQVANIEQILTLGSWDRLMPGEFGVILGQDLAINLGVAVGDQITLLAPQGAVTPVGVVPRVKRVTVTGVFNAGMYEYDSGVVYMHLADAAVLFRYRDGAVSGLQLKVTDMFRVFQVRRDFTAMSGENFFIRDWTQQHANFFKAIQLEKRMMFIVLALIIMVAAFNIVSTMVMVVTDKQKDIAVLRTLGATPASIQAIFIIQGLIIGIIGATLGLVLGVLLSLNIGVIVPFIENLFGFEFFPADVYYISQVPSKLLWSDVWSVSILAFGLTLVATLYPAWRASRIQPAEALRYE